jgi:hypothetical protein
LRDKDVLKLSNDARSSRLQQLMNPDLLFSENLNTQSNSEGLT